jgi:hypothetical protein
MCDDWDDGDPPDVVVHEWRRARKAHLCFACREPIRAGDRYHLSRQLRDGRWDDWKHCARCWAMCEALWAKGVDTIDYRLDCGEVWESPPPEIERLAFMLPREYEELA